MKWQPEIIWLQSHARIITCKLDCQMLKTCKCFTLNFLLVLIKPRRNVLKIMSILFPFWREGIKLYAQWFLLQMHLLQCTRVIQQNSFCILSMNKCITRWTWYGIGKTRKQILEGLKCTEVQYGDDWGICNEKEGYLNVRVAILGVFKEMNFHKVYRKERI